MKPAVYLVEPKLDRAIVIPVTYQQHARLRQEARAHHYRSLAAYVRDCKLGVRRDGEDNDMAS